MYLTSNELNDSSKLAYKDFMELPDDKKEGAYWNNLSNKNLSEFKSYVKIITSTSRTLPAHIANSV